MIQILRHVSFSDTQKRLNKSADCAIMRWSVSPTEGMTRKFLRFAVCDRSFVGIICKSTADMGLKFGIFNKHFFLQRDGLGGLGLACWPLVPKFAGSNPAETVGYFRAKKSSARLPSVGK